MLWCGFQCTYNYKGAIRGVSCVREALLATRVYRLDIWSFNWNWNYGGRVQIVAVFVRNRSLRSLDECHVTTTCSLTHLGRGGLWGFQIDFYLFIIGVRIFAYEIITWISLERTCRVSVMKCKKEIGFGSPSDLVDKDDCGIINFQCVVLLFHWSFSGLHVAQGFEVTLYVIFGSAK